MKKFGKICGWGALAIVLLFALILTLSPVATHIINTRGEEIVGRQLHADQVIINPYWGGVTIAGFQCKEVNGETDFVSFSRLYVQIAWPQLIAKRVKIRAIHLDGFNGQVLKTNDKLNFLDIIERFSKKDSIQEEVPADATKGGWKIYLDDIRINNSNIRYRDVVSDKQWKLEDITLHIPAIFFDNKQTNAGLEFGLPTGGRVGIIAGYKMQSNKYAVKLNLYDVHTDVVLPLVKDYLNVSGLGAKLNGSIHVDGDLDNITNIQLKGGLSVEGLSIRDTHNDQIAAMDELRVVVNKGDLNTNTFILDSLFITGVTGDYEVHENWNTLSRLVKENEKTSSNAETPSPNDENAENAETKSRESKPLVWMAKKVRITGHDLTYHDYSMKRDWEYAIKSLTVDGNNIATNGRNTVKMKATLTSDAQMNMDFTGGMDFANQDTRMDVQLRGVQLTDFDDICRNYTGYPINGGDLNVDSHIDVVSGKMDGNIRVVIDHPKVGKKEKLSKAPYKDIPVRTGVKLLTSAQDMIVLDVPVLGDAKNPKFSFRKVVGRALLKVFFGPLMGVNDRKAVSADELNQMQELLEEDDSVAADSTIEESTDVAMAAGSSVGLSEISE